MEDLIALDEKLDAALAEACEGMAFTEVERSPEGGLHPDVESGFWAKIEMIEPSLGELVLATSESVASELADATTGEDGSDLETCCDVLGEMANTLAGIWAKSIVPEGGSTALGIPKAGRGEWVGAASHQLAIYQTEDDDQIVIALR